MGIEQKNFLGLCDVRFRDFSCESIQSFSIQCASIQRPVVRQAIIFGMVEEDTVFFVLLDISHKKATGIGHPVHMVNITAYGVYV